MATAKETIKQWFKKYAKPTAEQFAAVFDSYRHKDEKITASEIHDLDDLLLDKADRIPFEAHRDDAVKHIAAGERDTWNNKLDKGDYAGTAEDLKNLTETKRDKLEPFSVVDDLGNDQNSTELDIAYPVAEHGLNIFRYTDEGANSSVLYFRKAIGNWVPFMSSDVANTLFARKTDKKKYVDETGTTLMEVPATEKLNLIGVKAGYDIAKGGYYIESSSSAPFIGSIEPVSMLPNTTLTVFAYGSSINQDTIVTTTSTDVVINFQTFEIHPMMKVPVIKLSLTANANEVQSVPFTFDNGKKATFEGFFSVILGEVFILGSTHFPNIPTTKIEQAFAGQLNTKSLGCSEIVEGLGLVIPANEDFRIIYSYRNSRFGFQNTDRGAGVHFYRTDDNSLIWRTRCHYGGHYFTIFQDLSTGFDNTTGQAVADASKRLSETIETSFTRTLERVDGVLKLYKDDNPSPKINATVYNGELKVDFSVVNADFINLKYIKLP